MKEFSILEKRLSLGDISAARELADMLARANRFNEYKKIISLLNEAIKAGIYEAYYDLALFYDEELNPAFSKTKAFKFFLIAAEKGIVSACNHVAVFYEGGVYVKKDLKKAMHWYERGARCGDNVASANLALNYEKGIGAKKNLKMSLKWYRCSYAQGNTYAKTEIRRLLKVIKKAD